VPFAILYCSFYRGKVNFVQSVLQLADTTPTSEGISPLRSVLSCLNAPFPTWISLLADRHSLAFQADLGGTDFSQVGRSSRYELTSVAPPARAVLSDNILLNELGMFFIRERHCSRSIGVTTVFQRGKLSSPRASSSGAGLCATLRGTTQRVR